MCLYRSRKRFPHFCRWVKLCARDDAHFTAATEAREVLYNLLALRARNILPRPSFCIGNLECFRPSAEMLTSVDINPGAEVTEIPPLYDAQPFLNAIYQGHGEYAFTTDNEVLFFKDKAEPNGYVILCVHPLPMYVPDIRSVKFYVAKPGPTVWTLARSRRYHFGSVR